MNPKLPSVMRGPGVEPGPVAGGDFKSSPALNEINHLARRRSSGAAVSGSERQRAEARWLPIWLPLLALALAGCDEREGPWAKECRAMMAMARTSTDSVLVMQARPTGLKATCAWIFLDTSFRADGQR